MSQNMQWQAVAAGLFPQGHSIVEEEDFLSGTALVDGQTVAVIGTAGHAPIGVEIALAQAKAVLDTVRAHPQRPIVILVDTQGQRLRYRDEMLGINSYMAHLGKCIALARARRHPVVGLVYDQALSGGFITSGLMADACYALPQATIRVMGLPAMARITKVPEERLLELSGHSPVFAPGPENYLKMGGVEAIWEGDLAAAMARALAAADPVDRRAVTGRARGGRNLAQAVVEAVLAAPDSAGAAGAVPVVDAAATEAQAALSNSPRPSDATGAVESYEIAAPAVPADETAASAVPADPTAASDAAPGLDLGGSR